LEKKVKSKEELQLHKSELLKEYGSHHSKHSKVPLLTKKERKALGIGKDEGKAVLRYARISSRKVMILLALIVGKKLDEAYGIVRFTPKGASEPVLKLLKSAESNAVNNNSLNRDDLIVAEAYATQGPTLKRFMPRARGTSNRIRKRTSHITLVVKESIKEKPKAKVKA